MSNKTETLSPERAVGLLHIMEAVDNKDEFEACLQLCEEAIERCMIAKSPDYEGDGYDEDGNLIYDTAYCPNCRHMFEVDYDIVSHCPDCGQKLDWSDING